MVRLHRRVFGTDRKHKHMSLDEHLANVFFDHPWKDARYPSLAYCDDCGRLAGCIGVMPRPMTLNGAHVMAAISHNFMVDPDARSSMAAIQLVREFLAGKQDVSICEGNEASRRIWESCKGKVSLVYSLCWVQPLRPASYVLRFLERRGIPGVMATVLRPATLLLDAALSRIYRRSSAEPDGLSAETLSGKDLKACIELVRKRDLVPVYDETSAQWMLDTLDKRKDKGELSSVVVRDANDKMVGWYVYYAHAGDVANVMQMGACPGWEGKVLGHLFEAARHSRAVAVSGHVDPQFFAQLGKNNALFHHNGTSWLLVHSRRSDVMRAVESCRTFLSPMEGEWWIDFVYG